MPPAPYGIIELGEDHWIVAEISMVADNCAAAWRALGRWERGCVVEIGPQQWAACRAIAFRPTRESTVRPAGGATFESRCGDRESDKSAITQALKDLLMSGKVRFERSRDRAEHWFAI